MNFDNHDERIKYYELLPERNLDALHSFEPATIEKIMYKIYFLAFSCGREIDFLLSCRRMFGRSRKSICLPTRVPSKVENLHPCFFPWERDRFSTFLPQNVWAK